MVGGSGLYVDAVLKGFDDFPDIDPKIREEINSNFDAQGIEYLQNTLQKLDPDYYSKLLSENPQTLQNPQRMKRFAEVCIGTKKPYSSFINQKKNNRKVIMQLHVFKEPVEVSHALADWIVEYVDKILAQQDLK